MEMAQRMQMGSCQNDSILQNMLQTLNYLAT